MSHREQLQFDDPALFRQEYERNISNGGAFIATDSELELREIIEVDLELRFCGERISLEAEVVHAAPGGIAVQFLPPASEIRARLEPFLGEAAAAPPRSARKRVRNAAPPPPEEEELRFVDEPASPPRRAPSRAAADSEYLDADEDAFVLDLDAAAEGGLELGEPGEIDLDPDAISADDLEAAAPSGDGVPEVTAERTDPALRIAMDPPAPSADPLADVEDRREAPRAAARVAARLVTTNLDLTGRTRDLSQTGVLISADGNDLPVGREVRLELMHPETGEPFEVRGKVSRHVKSGGTIAAVGVSFEGPPSDDLAAFVDDVRRNEVRQVASGITGVIQELGMANLIQMLGQSSALGTLTATHGREEGVVAFEDGRLRYALLGSLSGVKALARMLSWTEGEFEFRAHVDAITDEDDPVSLDAAILDAVRQLDEAERSDAPRFTGEQTFRIDRDALASQSDLPKVEEAVLDLATAGFTVRRILDVIPESDAQVLEALANLSELGILQPRD